MSFNLKMMPGRGHLVREEGRCLSCITYSFFKLLGSVLAHGRLTNHIMLTMLERFVKSC
jgi:hypothetical protein